jgi:hypothetical protein
MLKIDIEKSPGGVPLSDTVCIPLCLKLGAKVGLSRSPLNVQPSGSGWASSQWHSHWPVKLSALRD